MEEINTLVEEYNAAEIEQKERLIQLYDLLEARKGYRHVKFSGSGQWSNAWGRTARRDLALQSFIDPMVELIEEVKAGEALEKVEYQASTPL